jgi:hypothetical protein
MSRIVDTLTMLGALLSFAFFPAHDAPLCFAARL